MKKQLKSKEKHCGNCYYHCVYNYPDEIFCTLRFSSKESSIVATLNVCENWRPDYQECFCIQEALKKHRDKL